LSLLPTKTFDTYKKLPIMNIYQGTYNLGGHDYNIHSDVSWLIEVYAPALNSIADQINSGFLYCQKKMDLFEEEKSKIKDIIEKAFFYLRKAVDILQEEEVKS